MARPRKKTWKGHHPDQQDELYQRMDECSKVLDHLSSCPAWEIILRDLTEQRKVIDDNWQDITDPQKLDKARNLKYAYMHLINIRDKYKLDMDNAKESLKVLQNPQTHIAKDYDEE